MMFWTFLRKTLPKNQNLNLLILVFSLLFAGTVLAQSTEEQELFRYINTERQRESLNPLEWNQILWKVAVAHSEDMAQMGHVSHESSDGRKTPERIKASGVYASRSAENVASDINLIAIHTSLMESLYHRQNILNPVYTSAAVGVVAKGRYLYVTEIFVRTVNEYSLEEARKILLHQMNEFRARKGLNPLTSNTAWNDMAQSHVKFQENVSALGPPLITELMARQAKGALRTSIYTTISILDLPEEVQKILALNVQSVGIGFKRIKGDLCSTGCFLITLIIGPETG